MWIVNDKDDDELGGTRKEEGRLWWESGGVWHEKWLQKVETGNLGHGLFFYVFFFLFFIPFYRVNLNGTREE